MPNFRVSILRILALLIVAHTAWANLTVVGDKLSLDALVRTSAYWWRADQSGLARSEFAFERVGALAGLTGYLSPVVSLRVSGDVSALQPQDLYVDMHWRSGLGLRAGQLLLPLGMDAMTEPDSQALGSSFLVSYAKPAGTRDIGVQGSWTLGRLSVSAAVVNGTGANAGDNNDRKDLCGRLTVRPLVVMDAVLALRAYYGWPGSLDSVWRSTALEARFRRGPLELQAEFQNHRSQYARNNMAYLQAVWDIGRFEPVGRFDLVLPQGKRTEWMMTGGLNLRPVSDHLKVMLDCSYHRSDQDNWSVFGFSLRLQAGL
ncbi:MAG: hypothetical protein NTX53_08320 [candidate division WOR-3 bacterium]|nr:hypothetical protein [candidate division WOR-3 bacterium]